MRVTDSVSVEPEGVHKSVDQDDYLIEYDQVQSSFFCKFQFLGRSLENQHDHDKKYIGIHNI